MGRMQESGGEGEVFLQENFADGDWERFGYVGFDDRAMVEPAIKWMLEQKQGNKPFFASMLTVVTHHPYASPGNITPISSPQEAYQYYLRGLRYTDDLLKDMFNILEAKGLLENTLVIITGDHGEGFGEHGQIAHNGTAYNEGMRVPLIIRTPDKALKSGTIGGLWKHIDLMPTILDVAGIKIKGVLPGKNILKSDGHAEIITSCFYENYCLTHIDEQNKKLIYYYGKRNSELYNLDEDFNETKNLLALDVKEKNTFENKLVNSVHIKNSYEYVFIDNDKK